MREFISQFKRIRIILAEDQRTWKLVIIRLTHSPLETMQKTRIY
jgi:hypothetical protein